MRHRDDATEVEAQPGKICGYRMGSERRGYKSGLGTTGRHNLSGGDRKVPRRESQHGGRLPESTRVRDEEQGRRQQRDVRPTDTGNFQPTQGVAGAVEDGDSP